MKVDNKGFAISTILYSLLLMVALILFLLIGILNFERQSTNEFVDNIEDDLNNSIYKDESLTDEEIDAIISNMNVKYQVYVEGKGWQDYVKNDELSGTTGQSLSIEAIKISTENQETLVGDIEYQVYIDDSGWQEYKQNDEIAGTTETSKPIEAIRIKLTDTLAEKLDVYYSAHVSSIGWQDYVKNNEVAGIANEGKKIEAIKIKLVPKSS